MGDLEIRQARGEDLPVIQEVARRTIDQCYRGFLGDEGVDWFINSGESDRELQRHIEHCGVLLEGGAVVAFAIYFENLIHLMMVDVRLHRRGVGARLLAHVERQLFARGHATIRLETFAGNEQAINFYVKNGWSITGRQEDTEHGFIRVMFEKQA
jgi:GNAT superfamily N-acetyltransferase